MTKQTAVAPAQPPTALAIVKKELDSREEQLLALLGPTIPLERFLTVALHAVNSNADLGRCTPLSIVEAIREAAALRLEPTGLLGDAYIVRYGDKARLMPGYRGLMKLARRSGDVEMIDAQVVYEGDAFDLDLGSEPKITHRPVIDGERGKYRGAYAWARLRTGELVAEWMNYADIELVRRSSKAADSGPWVTFWGEMARKSVLRRLMKHLPLTTEAEQALRLEAEAEQEGPARTDRGKSRLITSIHERLGIAAPIDTPESTPAAAAVAPVEAPSAETPEPPIDGEIEALFDGDAIPDLRA